MQAGIPAAYIPLEQGGAQGGKHSPIDSDLAWARSASGITEAAARWEQFLVNWDNEVEDGYIQIRLDIAKLELARVYYLLGRREEGDRVMKSLDPLQLH